MPCDESLTAAATGTVKVLKAEIKETGATVPREPDVESRDSVPIFQLNPGEKFALLTITGASVDAPVDEARLPDGTWVLPSVPFTTDEPWEEWLGSLRLEELHGANLVLAQRCRTNTPGVLDGENNRLRDAVQRLFQMAPLYGVFRYDSANVVTGSVMPDGSVNVRQVGEPSHFRRTAYTPRHLVTIEQLRRAADLVAALDEVESDGSRYRRFHRGLRVLFKGFRELVAAERLHQFVRALEALVLPEVGATRKQFVHRCQTFCRAGRHATNVLTESFDMRSDTEHLNEWDKSLITHTEPEQTAFERTLQMESVASFAYTRILEDGALRKSFEDEEKLGEFWALDDGVRRKTWGHQYDLETVKSTADTLLSDLRTT
jgi:hypothetical protein